MSLKLLTGFKGHGKTVLLTKFLHDDYRKGRDIYSNYGLTFPHKKIDIGWMLEHPDQMVDASIGIDEAQTYFDCRCSGTKRNRVFSYLMLQSRKRGVDIYFTSQQFENVDIRIRRNIDYLYECTAYIIEDKRLRKANVQEIEAEKIDRVVITLFNYTNNKRQRFVFNPKKYFPLYDTNEFVDIIE